MEDWQFAYIVGLLVMISAKQWKEELSYDEVDDGIEGTMDIFGIFLNWIGPLAPFLGYSIAFAIIYWIFG